MRVALLSASASAKDAIGNQLAEKVAFFCDRGADVRVFVESDRRLHPAVRPVCHVVNAAGPSGPSWEFASTADLLIADYSQYYSLLEWLPLLAGSRPRVLLDYHGVTPVHLWGGHNRERLQKGIEQRGLVWFAETALAHSCFAAEELLRPTGFPADRLRKLPYVVDTDTLESPPTAELRRRLGLNGATVLLFVGRLAPNKRVPVLVEALAHLRELLPPVHAVVIGDTSDLYRAEAERCTDRAAELGVADRLHILGSVDAAELRDAYQSADIFVMPSRHEGFCLPVLEAMACGLPVIAARAAALPETIGSAGLTFAPDDAADLARQVRRVLGEERGARSEDGGSKIEDREWRVDDDHLLSNPRSSSVDSRSSLLRVAVVACRYGTDIVGGAEASLRTIAESLQQAGHHVEVFTTCVKAESEWSNHAAEGSSVTNGVIVHRFPIDPRESDRFQMAQQRIADEHGRVPAEVEHDFLTHSIRSRALRDALRGRRDEWDAVIAGPYLFGLTFDVAREFADKVLLVPCFHNEPAARLPLLLDAYRRAGGVLYHSPEEQQFAEMDIGMNHPRAACIGTAIDTEKAGNPLRGEEQVDGGRRYILYVGRYSPHKNLPLLLQYARRYASRHPDRFVFAFVGQGDLDLPDEPWLKDLGFVSETTRRDLIAGAEAVVQLSRLESLSLVVLEAWAQGVPAIVDRDCDVLAAQVRRCRGGAEVASYEAFALALSDLWKNPERWHDLGRQGQEYVRAHYGCRPTFAARLTDAVRSLQVPLREWMRQLGPPRAQTCSRARWRESFGQIIEEALHALPRAVRHHAEVRPRTESRTATAGSEAVLVPVQVHNGGSQPLVPAGPAKTVLQWRMVDAAGKAVELPAAATPLPALILPGQTLPAAVIVPVPRKPGLYQVRFTAVCESGADGIELDGIELDGVPGGADSAGSLQLVVEEPGPAHTKRGGPELMEALQAALLRAEELKQLPDDYADITEGWLASVKRRIKSKLLNNFKRAYVDVLARQQSAFNQQVVRLLQELAEYCAALEHAVEQSGLRNAKRGQTDKSEPDKSQVAGLEKRLARLEGLFEKEKLVS
jgi:glycosyltransferase involved in cell wall biosynthesis